MSRDIFLLFLKEILPQETLEKLYGGTEEYHQKSHGGARGLK